MNGHQLKPSQYSIGRKVALQPISDTYCANTSTQTYWNMGLKYS